jgi:uracil-DNA glycosylase
MEHIHYSTSAMRQCERTGRHKGNAEFGDSHARYLTLGETPDVTVDEAAIPRCGARGARH